MSVIFRSVVRWFLPVIITGQVLAACANPDPAALAAGQDQQLLTEALTRIANEYVDPVDSRELAYSAIRSMVQNLDPHSSFLTPAEFRALQETTQGSFRITSYNVCYTKLLRLSRLLKRPKLGRG